MPADKKRSRQRTNSFTSISYYGHRRVVDAHGRDVVADIGGDVAKIGGVCARRPRLT